MKIIAKTSKITIDGIEHSSISSIEIATISEMESKINLIQKEIYTLLKQLETWKIAYPELFI